MNDVSGLPRLLTPKQVVERLQLTLAALSSMRQAGAGPKFYRLGHRTIRYDAASVEAWLRERAEVQ